jgi:hypothetical protein
MRAAWGHFALMLVYRADENCGLTCWEGVGNILMEGKIPFWAKEPEMTGQRVEINSPTEHQRYLRLFITTSGGL